jgi:hypothetical protein
MVTRRRQPGVLVMLVACAGTIDLVARRAADRSILPVLSSQPAGVVEMPRFEDYLATVHFQGSPAEVHIRSAAYGTMFRTRLRKGAKAGPNFAGAFSIVMWGCGSSCQTAAVIDARTGLLSAQTLRTTNGLEYRTDSRLVLADPVHPGDPPLSRCAACGTPAAYVWSGTRFEPVDAGPHPHLSGDRPWRRPLQDK